MDKMTALSRREFLKRFVIATGGVIAGFELTQKRNNHDLPQIVKPTQVAAPPSQEPPQMAEPTSEVLRERILFDENGVKVWGDFKGVPTRWQDEKGQGKFDVEKFRDAQIQTAKDGMPHSAQVIRIQSNRPTPGIELTAQSSTERITTLPEGVLTPEKLTEQNIEIIGSEEIGFHIRKSAFEVGGIFEKNFADPQRKLTVVIVNAPTLTIEAFEDKRYDSVRKIAEKNFAPLSVRRKNQLLSGNSDELQNEVLTQAEAAITDSEYIEWGLSGITGLTIQKGQAVGDDNGDYVFIAIGQSAHRPKGIDILQLQSNPIGGFTIHTQNISLSDIYGMSRIVRLDPAQNYTNPETFKELEHFARGSFQWKGLAGIKPDTKDAMFLAIHENIHVKFGRELSALPVPPIGDDRLAYFSEQEVDFAAKAEMVEAYQHYQETGDNSLYPFVFENKKDGYFVIG